ncbi:MAG: DUF929 family protein [Chloroflexi bacterium]|nr:DUF929 family protein [Chloroflexota bacterium]
MAVGKEPTRRGARQRPQQREAVRKALKRTSRRGGGGQGRVVAIAAGVIVLLIASLIAIKLVTSGSSGALGDQPAPPEVVQAVTQIPPATYAAVGRGTSAQLPVAARGQLERGPSGKPLITYIGAEYCPFCAGQRWPMVAALSRFGTFSNLKISTSAADDVFPSTRTFSFFGAKYESQYVDFTSVELATNQRSGRAYAPLEKLTPAQEQMMRTYNAPPYVSPSSAGAIPFVNFANQYLVSGSSLDVGALQGMSWQAIAGSLSDPSSKQAQGIVGAANMMTATICKLTNDAPRDVCGAPYIQQIKAALPS